MSYCFVKIKLNNWNHSQWYFKPRSVQDINDFFSVVVRSEIRDGIQDLMKGGHPRSAWGQGVEAMRCAEGGFGWLEGSCRLEDQTYRDRVRAYLDGKEPLFSNGMQWLDMTCVDDILEERERETLTFPATYTIEDVRYMQWGLPGNKGKHWYAKVGNLDIRDEGGNMKWDTKVEAEQAAEWFLKKHWG